MSRLSPNFRALRLSVFDVVLASLVLFVIPAGNLRPKPATIFAGSTPSARGKELFATKGCAHCHGTDGINGDRAPDLQQIRNRMSAAQITTQIHDGSKGMPAFADDLSTPEINDLVAYLRTKRKTIVKPPPPPPAPPTPRPDPDYVVSAS